MTNSKLRDVVIYIFSKYRKDISFSRVRLTKLIYLVDWCHVVDYNTQITTITHYHNNRGAFSDEVLDYLMKDSDFLVEQTSIYMGEPCLAISLRNKRLTHSLTTKETQSIDYIIDLTKDLNWTDFTHLVDRTFPMTISARHSELDLIKIRVYFNEVKSKRQPQ